MKHLDLFSGIGGFSLACEWAGIETIGFVENDKYCQRVLRKHWPSVPIVEDIRDVEDDSFPRPVGLITGGFPCQDISYAKRRTTIGAYTTAGIDGKRSGLWGEMCRIIKAYQPEFVVAENVPALTAKGLDVVVHDLAEVGYDAEWCVMPAALFGAPHLRERIWIVAYPHSIGRDEEGLILGQIFSQEVRHSPQWQSSRAICQVHGKKALPESLGIHDGVPRGLHDAERLQCLGNAIVPQVAYEIIKVIKEIEG